MANYDPLEIPPGPQSRPVVETEGLTSAGHDIFFAAVATTRMPMIITDPRLPDNPIVFANPAFITMTGYSEDQLLGNNCRMLQGPDTDRATLADIRKAIAAEREIAVEILNYRKDGGSFWNALFISPVRDPAGKLIYFFASQLDVSRRRDAEDALRQAQKMEALGQLTGGIAHDFNNLLQVIFGHLDVIKLQAPDGPPQQAKSLTAIRMAAGKARTLTQQLLAFARKQQLEGRVVNLNVMATHLMELAERTLGSGIDLRLQPAAKLWNCRIDPTQAEVALLNILLNARDAMPDGGMVTIATANVVVEHDQLDTHSVPAPGRYVSLTVTDTGQGIPPDILARVLDPFFTTKDKGEGTGLGLSMVYGFAKQSGGSLTLYSEVGVGTTVRLYFPATSGEAPRQVEVKARAADRAGTEHVLVVDDRIEVAEMTELMLSSLGYRTRVCTGAAAALDALQVHGPFDLLLTDLIMPGGMNGVMLARRAREMQPGIKVLITTGFADASLDTSGVREGEFEVVYKPYGQTELARKVRQVLEGPTGVG